ncbi:hypothetical protein EV702DRAFT_1243016 [Suillus placidus]|uniref:Uncharacterized protein n=1 Tax=Suillus placidus TaxID=48579 RepID=A0A9P7CYS3_9AGAM|nr:hypothetical protein EV702DRAFT_1243016 [Suillus placidus]
MPVTTRGQRVVILRTSSFRKYPTEALPAAKSNTGLYEDYQKVYNRIAEVIDDADRSDSTVFKHLVWFLLHFVFVDGSFGPVVLRLAWHVSGTYDKAAGTGGSNDATMLL